MRAPPHLNRLGHGPPVLTIHGGPGFSHEYLLSALQFLARDHSIISYNQFRRTGKAPVDLRTLALELLSVIEQLQRAGEPPLRVVAHSWGALVLAAAAAEDSPLVHARVLGGVAINPVPLTRILYDQSLQRFLKKIPLTTKAKIHIAAALGFKGQSILRLLWPHYMRPGAATPPLPDGFSFHLPTYFSVSRSLGNYDYSEQSEFMARLAVVLSRFDATSSDMLDDWISQSPYFENFEFAGHFPMIEAPKLWEAIIQRAMYPPGITVRQDRQPPKL